MAFELSERTRRKEERRLIFNPQLLTIPPWDVLRIDDVDTREAAVVSRHFSYAAPGVAESISDWIANVRRQKAVGAVET
jgi:hypothetical protein